MIVFLVALCVVAPLLILLVNPAEGYLPLVAVGTGDGGLQEINVLPRLAATATFTGGALVWGALLLARDRWPAGRWPATLWLPVVAFLVVNLLALLFAVDWRASLMGEHLRYQGLAATLLYLLLFAAAATAVRTSRDLRWLLLAVFAGALGTAGYALIQQAGLDWIDWVGKSVDRPFSTLGQANALGAYLVAATSASAFLVLTAKARWQRAVLGAGVLAMLFALGFTVSRSAYLAAALVWLIWGVAAQIWFVRTLRDRGLRLALSLLVGGASATPLVLVSVVVFFVDVPLWLVAVSLGGALVVLFGGIATVDRLLPKLQERGLRLALRVGAAAVAAAPIAIALIVVLFVGLPQGRVAITSDANSEPLDARLSLWRLGVEMAGDEPLLGHGQDAFALLFAGYRDRPDLPGIGTAHVAPESAHNFFLDLAVGSGVLGLLAFLALVGAVLWHAGRRALATDDASLRLGLVALSTGLVGYLVAVLFGFSEAMTTWLFWLLLGATAGLLARVAPPSRRDTLAPESGTLASGMGAIGLFLVGLAALGWAATITAADLAAAQADRATDRGEHAAAVRLAGRAVTLNPLQRRYLVQQAQAYERSAAPARDVEALAQAVDAYETLLRRFEPGAFDVLGLALAKIELARVEGSSIVEVFGLFERAVELDPFNRLLRETVADNYEKLRFGDRARLHREVISCWSRDCD